MLRDLIRAQHDQIVTLARQKTAARCSQPGGDGVPGQGVPHALREISIALRSSTAVASVEEWSAANQGGELLRRGFGVSVVVHCYGDVCQAVTEVALEQGLSISTAEFRVLSRCLDHAIASALGEYQRQREQELSRHRVQRLALIVEEVSNAIIVLGMLRHGRAGLNGGAAALIDRSLGRLADVLGRSPVDAH